MSKQQLTLGQISTFFFLAIFLFSSQSFSTQQCTELFEKTIAKLTLNKTQDSNAMIMTQADVLSWVDKWSNIDIQSSPEQVYIRTRYFYKMPVFGSELTRKQIRERVLEMKTVSDFAGKDNNLEDQFKGLDNYLRAATAPYEASLKEFGIQFTRRPTLKKDYYKEKYGGYQWDGFLITPEGSNWLNRVASELKEKWNIDLMLDPVMNSVRSSSGTTFAASETEGNITLLAHRDLPRKASNIGFIERHELMHIFLELSRLGKVSFFENAPFHIRVASQNKINEKADAKSDLYQYFLSFEEMFAYADNLKMLSGEGSATRSTIQLLKLVSENSKIAALKALETLKKAGGQEKKDSEGNTSFHITSEDGFELVIFIPKKINISVESYANQVLHKSIQLADFNLDYFKSAMANTWLFQKKQLEYINSL